MVGTTEVSACKSVVFTQKFLLIENKEQLFVYEIKTICLELETNIALLFALKLLDK